MIIYRVQDRDGRGPYKRGMAAKWSGDEFDPDERPTFEQEFGPQIIDRMHLIMSINGGSFGCGFVSVEQANNWFYPDERRRLARLGYDLVSMTVDRVLAQSPYQLVFWRQLPLCKRVARIAWNQISDNDGGSE